MHEAIRTAVAKALDELGVSECDFTVEHPADSAHGEYATNVAMVAAKVVINMSRQLLILAALKIESY